MSAADLPVSPLAVPFPQIGEVDGVEFATARARLRAGTEVAILKAQTEHPR